MRNFSSLVLFLFSLVFASVGLSGCAISYLAELGMGQMKVVFQQVPVEDLLSNPETSEADKEKIRVVLQVKHFAEQELGFAPTRNYTTFYDTHGKPVSYNICACAPDSFELKSWWFPIVGTVPYLGYFELEPALQKSKELQEEGYDVLVSEVGGYSTLGWFTDPIFSAMLKRSAPSLINLIIHELTHGHIYLGGEANFNETLANFIADKGTEIFLQHYYAHHEWNALYIEEKRQKEEYTSFLEAIYQQLNELYQESLSSEEKLQWKKYILKEASQRYSRLKQFSLTDKSYPESFPADKVNNAFFAIFKTYHHDTHIFEQIYQYHDQHLPKTIAFLKKFEKSKDPFEEIRQWLQENGLLEKTS